MWSFVIDEDMPRSTAPALRGAGYAAMDVRDVGLAGRKDSEIFAFTQSRDAILITADREFANLLLFPLGSHAGIMITRTPSWTSTALLNELILGALEDLAGQDLRGTLVVIEPGRTRVRRPDSD